MAPTPIEREIVLAPGETVKLTTSESVTFLGVIGDSRCPLNALCIQGGDAIVRIVVRSRRTAGERDLHTGSLQPVTFDEFTITLVDLQPYPFSGRPTDPADYRATVKIHRP